MGKKLEISFFTFSMKKCRSFPKITFLDQFDFKFFHFFFEKVSGPFLEKRKQFDTKLRKGRNEKQLTNSA